MLRAHLTVIRSFRAARSCGSFLVLALLMLGLVPCASAQLIGDPAVGNVADDDARGVAEAFQANATGSGAVTTLAVYVDKSNKATKIFVGIYSDNNGNPGTLLGSGSAVSIKAGAWNTISISAANVQSGSPYWMAVLSAAGGAVAFREQSGTCISQGSAQTTLSSLPQSWTPGENYSGSCPLSAYGSSSGGGIMTLSPSPTALSFSNVVVGQSTQQITTLTNNGTATVTVTSATVSGTGFSLISPPSLPETVTPGGSAKITVQFTPTAVGAASGALTITSSATNSPTQVALSGMGVGSAASLVPWPGTVTFGTVATGQSVSRNLKLTATGAPITITQSQVTGSSAFSFSGPPLPLTLQPNSFVDFTVTFAPLTGQSATAALILTSNASATPTLNVALAGIAGKQALNCSSNPGTCGYPDATSTGVPAGTVLTPFYGTFFANQPGMVIDGMEIFGTISVSQPNITISRTRIHCPGPFAIHQENGASNLTVVDTEAFGDGSTECEDGILAADKPTLVKRVNFHTLSDNIYLQADGGLSVVDSYIHDILYFSGDHVVDIGFDGGNTTPLLYQHNTLENPVSSNYCVTLYAENGPVINATVDGNFLNGGGYEIWAGGSDNSYDYISENVHITNNRFGRKFFPSGGSYGPDAGWVSSDPGGVWSGNFWDDSGAPAGP